MAGVCEVRIECPRSVSRCRVCKVGYLGDIPLFLVLCDGSVLVLANECLDPVQVGICRRFFCDHSARLYLLADTGNCITLRVVCVSDEDERDGFVELKYRSASVEEILSLQGFYTERVFPRRSVCYYPCCESCSVC